MSGLDQSLLAFVSGLDEEGTNNPNKRNGKWKTKQRDTPGCTIPAGHADEEKVSLTDLTSVLNEEAGFANLKRHISAITEAASVVNSNGAGTIKPSSSLEVLAAPLPPHEQSKLERRAAYELTAKEANKWVPVIRANRAAKTLVFPAKQPPAALATNLLEASVADEVASGNRRSRLEELMRAALKKSGMDTEEGLITAEKMELAKLTPEAVEQRYRDLAKKRALLFFGERKARQQAKIKSKTFRKIVKRGKERKIMKELEASGDVLTTEELREQRMKAEMDRIRERMTLKTRKASRWAHQLITKKRLEAGSREEVMQQVRDKDRLRQEIMGKAAMLREAGIDSDGEDFEERMDDLGDDDMGTEDDDYEEKPKDNKPVRPTRVSLRDDYDCNGKDQDEDDSSANKEDSELEEIFARPKGRARELTESNVNKVVGRRLFMPANPLNKSDGEQSISEATKYAFATFGTNHSESKTPGAKRPKKSRHPILEAPSSNLQRLFAPEEERPENVTSSMDGKEGGVPTMLDERSRQQLDVVRKAFAADQVFSEFAAKKAAEIAADTPQDIDLTLPGWGSWGGIGIEPVKGKVLLKKRDGIDPRQRRDAHLDNVIIHEKRSKKALKLLVDKAPYPFKSREEYEQSLRNPTGKEWNCATSFAKKIVPRVQLRVGSIIEPIRFSKGK